MLKKKHKSKTQLLIHLGGFIGGLILLSGLMSLLISVTVNPELANSNLIKFIAFVIPLLIIIIFSSYLAITGAKRNTIIICENHIALYFKILNTSYLLWEFKIIDIKGYKKEWLANRGPAIVIYPHDSSRSKVTISNVHKQSLEIKKWLFDKTIDLGIAETEEKIQQAIISKKQAELNPNHYKIPTVIALVLRISLIGLFIWTYSLAFIPNIYGYFIIICFTLSSVCVSLLLFNPKLLTNQAPDHNKGSIASIVSAGAILPILCLEIRALLDYDLYNNNKLWLPLAIATLLFLFVLFIANKRETEHKEKKQPLINAIILIISIPIAVLMSHGPVVLLNFYFDQSQAVNFYSAQILDKQISTGKVTSYNLTLVPWGDRTEAKEVEVSEELYNNLQINDKAHISVYPGTLGIPWYIVE